MPTDTPRESETPARPTPGDGTRKETNMTAASEQAWACAQSRPSRGSRAPSSPAGGVIEAHRFHGWHVRFRGRQPKAGYVWAVSVLLTAQDGAGFMGLE